MNINNLHEINLISSFSIHKYIYLESVYRPLQEIETNIIYFNFAMNFFDDLDDKISENGFDIIARISHIDYSPLEQSF